MDLYRKRNILVTLMVLWLILPAVCGHIFSGDIPTLITIPTFAGWFYLYLRWWQCPCCLRSLGQLQISDIICPHCGKKIPRK